MYSGDELYGDDVTSGFVTEEEALEIADNETWPCNDCGLPCLKGDELCGPCYEKHVIAEREEAIHPEWRCPPRE